MGGAAREGFQANAAAGPANIRPLESEARRPSKPLTADYVPEYPTPDELWARNFAPPSLHLRSTFAKATADKQGYGGQVGEQGYAVGRSTEVASFHLAAKPGPASPLAAGFSSPCDCRRAVGHLRGKRQSWRGGEVRAVRPAPGRKQKPPSAAPSTLAARATIRLFHSTR